MWFLVDVIADNGNHLQAHSVKFLHLFIVLLTIIVHVLLQMLLALL